MSIKNDIWIKQHASDGESPLIEPFVDKKVTENVISFGLESYGYTFRVADDFRIFNNLNSLVVDPMHFDQQCFVEVRRNVVIIPPNSFALGHSVEYFRMPRNITGIIFAKSTYLRCGLVSAFSPAEAGWEGQLTIEISNTTSLPAKVYALHGIGQIVFLEGAACELSYNERVNGGVYNKQTGVTLPMVKKEG